eukprot:g49008.t1
MLQRVPFASMEDDDASVLATPSFSPSFSSQISHDPHAVKFCKSLLSLAEHLKYAQLQNGRYLYDESEEEEGSGVFEVNIDRVRGSLIVRRLHTTPRVLNTATQVAREEMAERIVAWKEEIASLQAESATLATMMQESQEDYIDHDALALQFGVLQGEIGQLQEDLRELEGKSASEVEVEVHRMSTGLELLVKEEPVRYWVWKEKMQVPMHETPQERVADEISTCKQNIALLKAESEALVQRFRKGQREGQHVMSEKALYDLGVLHGMIGRREIELGDLEFKNRMEQEIAGLKSQSVALLEMKCVESVSEGADVNEAFIRFLEAGGFELQRMIALRAVELEELQHRRRWPRSDDMLGKTPSEQ